MFIFLLNLPVVTICSIFVSVGYTTCFLILYWSSILVFAVIMVNSFLLDIQNILVKTHISVLRTVVFSDYLNIDLFFSHFK